MGIFHAGCITVYLSEQLIRGFTCGSAVHVLTAQLNKVLNVKLPRHDGAGCLFFVSKFAKLIIDYRSIATSS